MLFLSLKLASVLSYYAFPSLLQHLVFGGGEGSTSHFRHQGGGTPLDSDLDRGAGKEANSLAGGARGDGGVEEEGTNFHQHQDFDFEHLSI